MRRLTSFLLLCGALTSQHVTSLQFHSVPPQQQRFLSTFSRRAFLTNSALVVAAVASTAQPAIAVDNQADIQKLQQGYQRLDYLLNNWEKETTICGQSDNPYIGLCERTPLKVMDYMGYKSTKDPLFQAEKTMLKLQSLVPAEKASDYIDAVEQWTQASQEASGMAYVSSWGESNPGGGKDRVAYFIERSKKNVTDARDALKSIVDMLTSE
jgi:hypothetical protein